MEVTFGTLIGQALTFLVFILVTMKYVWPPLMEAMEDRRQKIADGLAAAEESERQLETAKEEALRIIKEARSEANAIREQAESRASQIMDQARTDAAGERERQMAAAENQIKLEMERAREELRGQVSGLVLAGAGKLMAKELDASDHAALLDELVAEL
ncbi:MAG: F0F1 ATP synthase subunit B [Wenzhouxiangellaceae bacterium]